MSVMSQLILPGMIIVVIASIFWPKQGLLWKWQLGMRITFMRVLIEGALKNLYDQEYKGVKSTLQNISGSLSISGNETAKLLGRPETLGLVQVKG